MNLNDSIIITLTDSGVKLYKDHWDQWEHEPENYPGLVDNTLTIQLWKFAHIFGQELYMGNPKPPCEMSFQFVN